MFPHSQQSLLPLPNSEMSSSTLQLAIQTHRDMRIGYDTFRNLCDSTLPKEWIECVIDVFAPVDSRPIDDDRHTVDLLKKGDIRSATYVGPTNEYLCLIRELVQTNTTKFCWDQKRRFKRVCRPLTPEQVSIITKGVDTVLELSRRYCSVTRQLPQRCRSSLD